MDVCLDHARRGEPAAVATVVDRLRPRLSRMAGYYARQSGEDADDLFQEACLGLLEALPELDLRIGSPEQHLIQRARWRLLDALRRARRRRCEPLDETTAEMLPDPDDGHPLDRAALGEFTRQLKQSQQAVLACLLAGLTWREAGAQLGCTSANVAYHVRQIRRRWEEWAVG